MTYTFVIGGSHSLELVDWPRMDVVRIPRPAPPLEFSMSASDSIPTYEVDFETYTLRKFYTPDYMLGALQPYLEWAYVWDAISYDNLQKIPERLLIQAIMQPYRALHRQLAQAGPTVPSAEVRAPADPACRCGHARTAHRMHPQLGLDVCTECACGRFFGKPEYASG